MLVIEIKKRFGVDEPSRFFVTFFHILLDNIYIYIINSSFMKYIYKEENGYGKNEK